MRRIKPAPTTELQTDLALLRWARGGSIMSDELYCWLRENILRQLAAQRRTS